MTEHKPQAIVPGISLSESGQATVDPDLTEVLIELAIKIDDQSRYPVDVEHVLAAIVLAARNNAIDKQVAIDPNSDGLINALMPHIETVFRVFDGKLGEED